MPRQRFVKTTHPDITYRVNKAGQKVYYVRVQVHYRRRRKACGTRLADAVDFYRRVKVQQADGDTGIIHSSRISVAALTEDYRAAYRARARERNWAGMDFWLRAVVRAFGPIEARGVTPGVLERFIQGERARGRSARSINGVLESLRAILNYGVRMRELKTAQSVSLIKYRGRRRARLLAPDEIKLALSKVTPLHAVAIRLDLETGLRLGEMCRLRPPNVDALRHLVHVIDTKSGEPRDVPLTETAEDILREHLRADGLFGGRSESTISYRFHKERVALEMTPWRFHDLRGTWATGLLRRGIDLYTVMRWGGWKSLKSIMPYLHALEDEAAVEAMRTQDGLTKRKEGRLL